MDKKSATIIGISIIIGCIILGATIYTTSKDFNTTKTDTENRYEMISPNDTNIIIFDKKTGRYWRKFISPGEGPTEWTEETMEDFIVE